MMENNFDKNNINLLIENLNLKIKLRKYEIEIDNLFRLIDISKHIYENSFIYKSRKEKLYEIKRNIKENVIIKKYINSYGHGIAICNNFLKIEMVNNKFLNLFKLEEENTYHINFFDIIKDPPHILNEIIEKAKEAEKEFSEKIELKIKGEVPQARHFSHGQEP